MSQENVEVVREFLEALWDRRDYEAARLLANPGLKLDWSESRAPYAGVTQGFDAAVRWFQGVAEAFSDYGVERRSFSDCGEAFVVVEQSISGRGRDSGVEVRATGATVWEVQSGKVVSGKLFQSKTEALEAAGPTE